MENYFYIPINSLNFNNLLSSESISPPSFYEKRGYGFKRFEKLSLNPFTNSFLAYSKIPLVENIKTDRDEYAIYLAMPNKYLEDVKKSHEKQDILISQIENTLYINPYECFFITVSNEEKRKIIASSKRSLEVKNTSRYFDKLVTLEELNFQTFDFNSNILQSITDLKSIDMASLLRDQKINKFKGFLYGYLSGKLNEQPEEVIMGKLYYQEFINNFSLLMNDLSTNINGTRSKSKNNNQNTFNLTFDKLINLKEKVVFLLDVFDNNKIEQIVLESFNLSKEELELTSKRTFKQSQNSILDILITFIKSKQPELNSVENLLDILLYKSKELAKYSNAKLYNDLENDFNSIRNLISQKINEIEILFNSKKSIDSIPFKINEGLYSINIGLEELSSNENICYQVIINEFLSRTELSSSDEIAQSRLDIITHTANSLKTIVNFNNSPNGSIEILYLRKLYESLKTIGVGFKIKETDNLALQSFACFLNRYSDNEKLLDFMVKNAIGNNGLVYGIWGSAYGYANLSKIVTEPLFNNHNVYRLVANYFNNSVYDKNLEFNILDYFIDKLEMKQLKQAKGYPINDGKNFINEPINKFPEKLSFIELIIENKKLRGNDDWIETIKYCFEYVSKEIELGVLFDAENAKVSLFKELLVSKSKKIKGFGEAKIDETIKVYLEYLK